MMIPDYFHFLLTGESGNEYTNATTTQLINPETKDWDWELIRMLGYPEKIFQKIRRPGTVLGKLKEEVAEKVGFSCDVILPATHDTGSAIMAIPSTEENVMYISSGTWSLMGSECLKPICTEQSRNLNFTNEGGYDYRFRFLKNIMGLWMIQSIRREQQKTYSFAEICGMAEKCKMFPSRVDVNSPVFLAPESMTEAVKAECRKTGQTVPESLGELAAVVYESLAVCYGKTAAEIGKLTGKKYDVLHVIGGGANVDYLNQITADYTGKIIVAGPGEATALGNILAQMLQAGVFKNLQEARGAVALSFPLRKFYPERSLVDMLQQRYESAKETYAKIGVDTDAAIQKLKTVPVSLHCWQGDDVTGFDHDGPLTGGIQTTGNYPGRARTPEELFEDMDQALRLMPGKKKINVHACYAIFENGEFADRDKLEPKHFQKW